MFYPQILKHYDEMLAPIAPDIRQENEPGTSPAHMRWMLTQMAEMDNPFKFMRWLGNIQRGCIETYKLTTTTAERNFTRPIFAGEMYELQELREAAK